MEPPECLLEIIDQITEDLEAMLPNVGLGWLLIELAVLRGKTEKRLTHSQRRLRNNLCQSVKMDNSESSGRIMYSAPRPAQS